MDGVKRVGRIILEDEFAPAEGLYDTVDEISGMVGNYGHLSPYIGNKRRREDSGHAPTPSKKRRKLLPGLSEEKNMGPKVNAVNALVHQSSMVVKGKRKLKKKPVVKVSNRLRAKVKKVMEGEQATGSYTTVYTGFIGSVLSTNSDLTAGEPTRVSASATDLGTGLGSQVALLGPSYRDPAGSRTQWGKLWAHTPNSVVVGSDDVDGSDFNFFTIGKILNAASVCFNEKVINTDAYIQTGNLTTTFTRSTGAPTPGIPGSLKINVKNSWVQFTIRNMSQRILELEIFECTPVLKFVNNTALDSFYKSMTGANQALNDTAVQDNTVRYFSFANSNIYGSLDGMVFDGTVDALGIAKKFGFPFKVVKKTMALQPYETCIHSIKGPTGLLDFAKLAVNNVHQTALLKNFSVSCIFSVRVDQALKLEKSSASRFSEIGAEPVAAGGAYMGAPICIEMKESYSISVPEVAGFIKNADAAGLTQLLNLRKKKIVYCNFTQANGNTYMATAAPPVSNTFWIANENNPMATGSSIGNIF